MHSAAERVYDIRRDNDEALGQFLLTLRTRGLRTPRLLEAVERAPRTEFVASEHIGFAYHDISLPLPCGQETGRPIAVVEAVQALALKSSHNVLEIGTGSGWQTALIGGLAGAVVSVERWLSLAEDADAHLRRQGFDTAVVVHGDGMGGLPEAAPFDRIILNASLDSVPGHLFDQLADDGFIIAPLRRGGRTILARLGRVDGRTIMETVAGSDAPRLVAGVAELV